MASAKERHAHQACEEYGTQPVCRHPEYPRISTFPPYERSAFRDRLPGGTHGHAPGCDVLNAHARQELAAG
jgi:hypothetical protein